MAHAGYTEIKPGLWQRPTGTHEGFFELVATQGHPLGHEHWAITASAGLIMKASGSTLFSQALKNAWVLLRFQHPDVAAIVKGEFKTYQVPTPDEVEKWASDTFHIHSDVTDADSILPLQPELLMSLHWLPECGRVIIHTSHWRVDGLGVAQLFRRLLALTSSILASGQADVDGLKWGEEVTRLSKGLEDAAQSPETPSPEAVVFVEKETSAYVEHLPAIGFPCDAPLDTLPGKNKTLSMTFSEKSTSAIVAACKSKGLGVTGAVHAAIVTALYEVAPAEHKSRGYTGAIPTNLRPALEDQLGPGRRADVCSAYVTGAAPIVPAGLTWEQQAKVLQKSLSEYRSSLLLSALRFKAKRWLEVMGGLAARGLPPGSEATLSSVGILDSHLPPFYNGIEDQGSLALDGKAEQPWIEVTDWRLDLECLDRVMALYLLTYRGKMQLSINWNEAFYGEEVPRDFLKRVAGILERELEVTVELA